MVYGVVFKLTLLVNYKKIFYLFIRANAFTLSSFIFIPVRFQTIQNYNVFIIKRICIYQIF